MQDIQNGNYERSVNGKKTVDNGSHFLTAFYKLVVPTAMLLPFFLYFCTKLRAKRGGSAHGVLLFTFGSPCKVMCHACVFKLPNPDPYGRAKQRSCG